MSERTGRKLQIGAEGGGGGEDGEGSDHSLPLSISLFIVTVIVRHCKLLFMDGKQGSALAQDHAVGKVQNVTPGWQCRTSPF